MSTGLMECSDSAQILLHLFLGEVSEVLRFAQRQSVESLQCPEDPDAKGKKALQLVHVQRSGSNLR